MVVLGLNKECLGYEQVFVLFRVWVGRDLLMFQSLRGKSIPKRARQCLFTLKIETDKKKLLISLQPCT